MIRNILENYNDESDQISFHTNLYRFQYFLQFLKFVVKTTLVS